MFLVLSHLNRRLQPTVYIEMLYLNSCEICTKIHGKDGNKVKFTLKRFRETYIFGVYLSGSQPVDMSLLRKSGIDRSNKIPYFSVNPNNSN